MPRPKVFEVDDAVATAMRAFWHAGYTATSIDQLTEAMGINRSSLYHAFGGKEPLFAEVLRRYDREIAGRFLGEMEKGGGLSAIRRYFDQLLTYHASKRGRDGCLMTSTATELAPHDPSVREQVHRHLLRIEDAFYRSLKAAQAAGDVPANAPLRDLARHLTAITHGLHVLAKLGTAPEFLRSVVRSALGTVPRSR